MLCISIYWKTFDSMEILQKTLMLVYIQIKTMRIKLRLGYLDYT